MTRQDHLNMVYRKWTRCRCSTEGGSQRRNIEVVAMMSRRSTILLFLGVLFSSTTQASACRDDDFHWSWSGPSTPGWAQGTVHGTIPIEADGTASMIYRYNMTAPGTGQDPKMYRVDVRYRQSDQVATILFTDERGYPLSKRDCPLSMIDTSSCQKKLVTARLHEERGCISAQF